MNLKKLKQMAEAYQRLHGLMDAEKNSYLSGLKDALNLPEVKAMREALEFACADDMWTSNGEYNELFKYNYSEWYQDILKKALAELEGIFK